MRRILGPARGEVREIDRELVIGRGDADLSVADPEVSRRHAVVRPVAGGVELEDLGSRNGTFVDEGRIERPVVLTQSAAVRVGETELRIEVAVAQPTRVRAADVAPGDVTAKRPIPDPGVTTKRPFSRPEVTVRREQPAATAQATGSRERVGLIRTSGGESGRPRWAAVTWVLAGLLPLIGLISLLLHSQLDPHLENYKVHFVVFLCVGALVFALAYQAGEAATRRGDARVLLISLAFLATGGFLGLHAIGTPGILFSSQLSGFEVAIPVGLLVAAVFAFASAFVDWRPALAPLLMRRRAEMRRLVMAAMGVWAGWTVAKLSPLDRPTSEAASGSLLAVMAVLGVVVYGVSAARYWVVYRHRMSLLPASVIACFVLLSEAMIGVTATGERNWHASWWEWHGLIVAAYVIVGFAARREWRDERFRHLYLPTTRERRQNVSVLFSDLAGFTSFSERSPPADVAALLGTYYAVAAPLISRKFGGEVEKFIGDGMMATFNSRGDQPDHAVRAARAGLALQRELGRLADEHPGWPRLRVGVNTGEAVLRELGGHGHVAYTLVGDTINTGSRLEGQAPVGTVLIGAETYRQLPDGAIIEAMSGLRVKGKEQALEAYVLHTLPA